jgi:hypothetical protein
MNKEKTIYEVEEIGTIINYMKAEKTITDISETNGISTISSNSLLLLHSYYDIYLQVGQLVTINKINYPFLSVDLINKTFTISATGLYTLSSGQNPVKTLIVTKWNLAINYLYGTRSEINEILLSAEKDPEQKLSLFPLVWLFVNNEEDHNPELTIDLKTNLKYSIVHLSNSNYRAHDRLDGIFKPVLQPLWELLFETMKSPFFTYMLKFETGNKENTKYKKYKRFFYGSSDKTGSVLTCPTDAIEISIDLNFLKQY